MASDVRVLMVASVIQRSLAKLLLNLGMREISVSEVRVSHDLTFAKVYVCSFMDKGTESLLAELELLRPTLFKKLRKELSFRVPNLEFKIDDSYSRCDKISRAIKCAAQSND